MRAGRFLARMERDRILSIFGVRSLASLGSVSQKEVRPGQGLEIPSPLLTTADEVIEHRTRGLRLARHVARRSDSNFVAIGWKNGHRADIVDRSKMTQLRHWQRDLNASQHVKRAPIPVKFCLGCKTIRPERYCERRWQDKGGGAMGLLLHHDRWTLDLPLSSPDPFR
jgi:hypothetical protein